MMPRRVSGRERIVVVVRTRKSRGRVSSRPPPKAGPAMAAMVGMGRSSRAWRVLRREVRKFWVLQVMGWVGGWLCIRVRIWV